MGANKNKHNVVPLQADGRSSQMDSRTKLIHHAAELFARHGFSGTTYRMIGAASGVHFQTIRTLFGSKEDLWDEVVKYLVEQRRERGASEFQDILATDASVEEILRMAFHNMFNDLLTHPHLELMVCREAMKGSERFHRVYIKHMHPNFLFSLSFFEKVQGFASSEDPVDPRMCATILTSLLLWPTMARAESEIMLEGSFEREEVLDGLIDAMVRMFKAIV